MSKVEWTPERRAQHGAAISAALDSPEVKARHAAGLKSSYASGTRRAYTRQPWTPERRAQHGAAVRAAYKDPEVKARLSTALKASHASGSRRTEARAASWKIIQAKGQSVSLAKNTIALAQAKVRGSCGFGRQRRGNPDHAACKEWCVLSPAGVQYRFTNLSEWCRQNEGLFVDPAPGAKRPLWRRAINGICRQAFHPVACSWAGWVLQNVWERRDPISRILTTNET